MPDFMPIIKQALEKARRVKATPAEFREGIGEWVDEIEEEIEASEATDPDEDD